MKNKVSSSWAFISYLDDQDSSFFLLFYVVSNSDFEVCVKKT